MTTGRVGMSHSVCFCGRGSAAASEIMMALTFLLASSRQWTPPSECEYENRLGRLSIKGLAKSGSCESTPMQITWHSDKFHYRMNKTCDTSPALSFSSLLFNNSRVKYFLHVKMMLLYSKHRFVHCY